MKKLNDTFSVVFSCEKCTDTGIIFAANQHEWSSGSYAFRCDCILGKSKHMPEMPLHSKWIPEHLDKRPTAQWFSETFSRPNFQDEYEFKRRLNIWGREFFDYTYREWRKTEKEKLKKGETENENA